jgi:hypothetical protein
LAVVRFAKHKLQESEEETMMRSSKENEEDGERDADVKEVKM